MSYKDDEEIGAEVDINEEDVDILDGDDELDEALLDDDDLLIDEEDDYLGDDDEEGMEDFAGLDGSEYN